MPIQIKAPDGSIAQFPDGTSDATITAVMAKSYGGPKPQAKTARTPLQYASGVAANINAGLPLAREFAGLTSTVIDAATGRGRFRGGEYSPGTLRASYDDAMASGRAIQQGFAADHPVVAPLARGVGLAGSVAIPMGRTAEAVGAGGRAVVGGSRAVNALRSTARAVAPAARGAVTAGATGAVYAAADEQGSLGDRLRAGSRAARDPVTLALGAGGGALASRLGRSRVPKARYSPAVVDLVKQDVQLTPGQARGGVAKAFEDAATSLPVAGQAITDARKVGMASYNRAALRDALSHIDETLPDHIPDGPKAVQHAGDRFKAAYERLLPKGGVKADPEFGRTVGKLAPIVETLTAPNQARLEKIIQLRVMDRFAQDNGILSGDMYQRVDRELNYDIDRFKKGDPDQVAMADALETVRDGVRDAAARQNPAFAAAKARIDAGYARLAQIEEATVKAVNEGGVYTPAQATGVMVRADKRRRVRARGVARGEALNQDFHAAAQQVLPSKIGDSGTAARNMVGFFASAPGLLIGHGMAGAPGAAGGMAATVAALQGVASRYSPQALELFNTALSEKVSRQEAQAALAKLGSLAATSPALQKVYEAASSRLGRAAAAVGETRAEQTNNPANRLTSSTR